MKIMPVMPWTQDEAKVIAASMSAVNLAAGWVVEDDEAWNLFCKFMEEQVKIPNPPNARQVMDKAIETIDGLRTGLCERYNIKTGNPYPRKYP
jgi:hypothetical protein